MIKIGRKQNQEHISFIFKTVYVMFVAFVCSEPYKLKKKTAILVDLNDLNSAGLTLGAGLPRPQAIKGFSMNLLHIDYYDCSLYEFMRFAAPALQE